MREFVVLMICLVIIVPTVLAFIAMLMETASFLDKAFGLRVSDSENDMKGWFDL